MLYRRSILHANNYYTRRELSFIVRARLPSKSDVYIYRWTCMRDERRTNRFFFNFAELFIVYPLTGILTGNCRPENGRRSDSQSAEMESISAWVHSNRTTNSRVVGAFCPDTWGTNHCITAHRRLPLDGSTCIERA